MKPLPPPFCQTRQFAKSSMGILPLSFPSTPVRPTTRSAFTLPPHLPRVFHYPQHRRPKRWSGGFSRFRLVLGVARCKNGLSRVNYTPQLIIERGTKEWGQRNQILLPPFSCRPFTSQYRPFTG